MRPIYLDVDHRYDTYEKIHRYGLFKVTEGGFKEANLKEADFLIPQCPSQKIKAFNMIMQLVRLAKTQ